MPGNNRGYTLTELIVVLAIFVTVLVVTSSGFETVLTQVGQQTKQMETDIGSIVGLEVFRSDLQNAGYGLPWAMQSTPAYTEVTATDSDVDGSPGPISATFWPSGRSPISYNDAPAGVPRAVLSGDTTFNSGSKYLVVKSLTVLPSAAAKKWVTVTYGDTGKSQPSWGNAERDFKTGDSATERVMVMRNTFVDGIPTRQLQVNASGGYSTVFRHYTTLAQPHSSGDVFQVYGIDETSSVRMPFNRADYYVRRPSNPPTACAPNTGVLYKAVLNHASNGYTVIPLLDCVADMQVVYGTGPAGSSQVNLHQTTVPDDLTPKTIPGAAKEIREQLKEIRVYILAHVGRKDSGYKFPAASMVMEVGERFGGVLQGRTFDLSQIGPDWQNYRWKLYTIVVRPQNLIQ